MTWYQFFMFFSVAWMFSGLVAAGLFRADLDYPSKSFNTSQAFACSRGKISLSYGFSTGIAGMILSLLVARKHKRKHYPDFLCPFSAAFWKPYCTE